MGVGIGCSTAVRAVREGFRFPGVIQFGFSSQPLWADEKKGASVGFNAVEQHDKESNEPNGPSARKGDLLEGLRR